MRRTSAISASSPKNIKVHHTIKAGDANVQLSHVHGIIGPRSPTLGASSSRQDTVSDFLATHDLSPARCAEYQPDADLSSVWPELRPPAQFNTYFTYRDNNLPGKLFDYIVIKQAALASSVASPCLTTFPRLRITLQYSVTIVFGKNRLFVSLSQAGAPTNYGLVAVVPPTSGGSTVTSAYSVLLGIVAFQFAGHTCQPRG